jgi:hypothetical protein
MYLDQFNEVVVQSYTNMFNEVVVQSYTCPVLNGDGQDKYVYCFYLN